MTAKVFLVHHPAVGKTAEFGRWEQSVADAHGVDVQTLFGSRDRSPTAVHPRDDGPLNFAFTFGSQNRVRVEKWYPLAAKVGHVVSAVAKLADISNTRARQTEQRRGPWRRRCLEHGDHVGPVAMEHRG